MTTSITDAVTRAMDNCVHHSRNQWDMYKDVCHLRDIITHHTGDNDVLSMMEAHQELCDILVRVVTCKPYRDMFITVATDNDSGDMCAALLVSVMEVTQNSTHPLSWEVYSNCAVLYAIYLISCGMEDYAASVIAEVNSLGDNRMAMLLGSFMTLNFPLQNLMGAIMEASYDTWDKFTNI